MDKVREFEEQLHLTLKNNHKDILDNFKAGKLNPEDTSKLEEIAADLAKQFKA